MRQSVVRDVDHVEEHHPPPQAWPGPCTRSGLVARCTCKAFDLLLLQTPPPKKLMHARTHACTVCARDLGWALGQVGFREDKAVKKIKVAKRVNEIVNRLNRTKQERYPDLATERETWDKQARTL